MTAPPPPSTWVQAWAPIIRAGGRVLDLACGSGRHALWLARQGFRVEAVDRDESLLLPLSAQHGIQPRVFDLEAGGWPYGGERFDGIVVTHYLHRPLFPRLLESLAARGVLIYETFARGNERYGRPANPAFLLEPGELLDTVRGKLRVIAYEDRYVELPKPAMLQRICAAAVEDLSDVWR